MIGIDENWELEILLKCKKEMLLTLWMRMYYLGLINTMVLSEEYGVLPDESFVKDTKKNLLFQKKLSEKSKYLESWCAGNTCIERDQNRYDELKGRIKKYTRSLKQLYQC